MEEASASVLDPQSASSFASTPSVSPLASPLARLLREWRVGSDGSDDEQCGSEELASGDPFAMAGLLKRLILQNFKAQLLSNCSTEKYMHLVEQVKEHDFIELVFAFAREETSEEASLTPSAFWSERTVLEDRVAFASEILILCRKRCDELYQRSNESRREKREESEDWEEASSASASSSSSRQASGSEDEAAGAAPSLARDSQESASGTRISARASASSHRSSSLSSSREETKSSSPAATAARAVLFDLAPERAAPGRGAQPPPPPARPLSSSNASSSSSFASTLSSGSAASTSSGAVLFESGAAANGSPLLQGAARPPPSVLALPRALKATTMSPTALVASSSSSSNSGNSNAQASCLESALNNRNRYNEKWVGDSNASSGAPELRRSASTHGAEDPASSRWQQPLGGTSATRTPRARAVSLGNEPHPALMLAVSPTSVGEGGAKPAAGGPRLATTAPHVPTLIPVSSRKAGTPTSPASPRVLSPPQHVVMSPVAAASSPSPLPRRAGPPGAAAALLLLREPGLGERAEAEVPRHESPSLLLKEADLVERLERLEAYVHRSCVESPSPRETDLLERLERLEAFVQRNAERMEQRLDGLAAMMETLVGCVSGSGMVPPPPPPPPSAPHAQFVGRSRIGSSPSSPRYHARPPATPSPLLAAHGRRLRPSSLPDEEDEAARAGEEMLEDIAE